MDFLSRQKTVKVAFFDTNIPQTGKIREDRVTIIAGQVIIVLELDREIVRQRERESE